MEEETKKQIWIFAFMLVLGITIIMGIMLFTDKDSTKTIIEDYNDKTINGINSAQITWNNLALYDSTNYDEETNVCTANRYGMEITISPCLAYDVDRKGIEQDVNFKWTGAQSRNISWVFVYDQQLDSGSIDAFVNKVGTRKVPENTWVNNYLVDKIISYTNLTQKPAKCDLGNLNNTRYYSVVRSYPNSYGGEPTITETICFSQITVVNSTAFRISGNADIMVEEEYTYQDWKDVSEKITPLGVGLLNDSRSYYKVEDIKFNPGQEIKTKWKYTPKDSAKSGKWHILGFDSETGLVQSVIDDEYIYVDPWWSGGSAWKFKKEVTNLTGNIITLRIDYNSNMQADYDDLRFLNSSESGELPYARYFVNATTAYYKVQTNQSTSLYMYYGNPAASYTGSIKGVYHPNLQDAYFFDGNFSNAFWNVSATNESGYLINYRNESFGAWFAQTKTSPAGLQGMNYGDNSQMTLISSVNLNSASHIGALADTCSYCARGMAVREDSGPKLQAIMCGGGSCGTTSLTFTYGVPHYTVLTGIDGGTTSIYLDSSATTASLTKSWNNPTGPFAWGAYLSGTTAYESLNGTMDYALYINQVINTSQVDYFKLQTAPYAIYGAETQNEGTNVILNSPANSQIINSSVVNFNFSISVTQANYTNYTLFVWNLDGTLNQSSYSVQTGNSNWTIVSPLTINTVASVYKIWNVQACSYGAVHSCSFALTNNTFLVDVAAPIINISAPSDQQIFSSLQNQRLNWTVVDGSLDSCWYRNTTGSNVSVTCSANTTTFNISQFGTDEYIIFYANDSTQRLAQVRVNFTAVNVTYAAPTYTATTFDTVTNYYTMQIQKSPNVTAVPTLWYNGTAINNYTEVSNGLFNITYQIPSFTGFVYNRTNNFYINWTLSFNGGTQYNQSSYSLNRNQQVFQILMNVCGGIYQTKLFNVTFVDEVLNLRTNATLDASSWTYAATTVGTGASKTFTFANTTGHNFEYDFCYYPSFTPSLTITASLQASKSDSGTYPQRKYNILGETYLNTTGIYNITMYLLNINNGITSSYQVITIGNQVISGAYIKLERTIGSTTVKVADGYTDSSGIMTAFLNPNYEHTLTASKTGYTSQTHSLYPSQSIYTITMGSGSNYFQYNSSVEGITWTKWPPSGLLTRGMYNFTWQVHSRSANIYNCTFSIRYPNNTIVGGATGCNSTVPNTGGIASAMINTSSIVATNNRLFGTYSFATDRGTYIVETDGNWKLYDGNYTQYLGSLKEAMKDTINMPEWGGCPDGFGLNTTDGYCYDATGFKTSRDDTVEFSRIVFFFLIFAIALAILNFFTGYDTAYPGAFLYLFTGVVVLLSLVNGVSGPGYFYLADATSFGGTTFSPLINNWLIAVHFVMLSAIYFFTTNKRYQAG